MAAVLVIVMGVSGTGKSTLGTALAVALQMPYIDGDDLHPRVNVEKMAAGQPLTDADRGPWLRTIRATAERVSGEQRAEGTRGVVVACSALRRRYRDVLRGVGDGVGTETESGACTALRTYFVFIEGGRDVLMERMLQRSGHFMKATMLDSQLATLESPRGEDGVVVVAVEDNTAVQVEQAMMQLNTLFADTQ
ncbi:P-loop containing nucleoside triphosphate hydrolase protein [Mycena sp. CBHHK59/15]|nr:P-loop containing nucleoside triphosphate hydrolase protein [Mycena sp. CBHHK59/15]